MGGVASVQSVRVKKVEKIDETCCCVIEHVPFDVSRNINVLFVCDEWGSSKGGLSTFNREFAVKFAKSSSDNIKVHCYVCDSNKNERQNAIAIGVNLIIAKHLPGASDPVEGLKIPPDELRHPDVVVGHGRKFGLPAQVIADRAKCKWVQFVHVYCEALGKFKQDGPNSDAIAENERKNNLELELCKKADLTVAVGTGLQMKFARRIRGIKVITPGIFENFDIHPKEVNEDVTGQEFEVFMFGRGSFEDFFLKGYDVVGKAIASLGRKFKLTFVGAPEDKHRNIETWFCKETNIARNQLTIRRYCGHEEMKEMFSEADVIVMPSRTEGFGLIALEGISAGVPVLISTECGISKALEEVDGGSMSVVVDSELPEAWARKIRELSEQSPGTRETNALRLREKYGKQYEWERECKKFEQMILDLMKEPRKSQVINFLVPDPSGNATKVEAVISQEENGSLPTDAGGNTTAMSFTERKSAVERKVKSESDQDPGSDPDLVSSGQLPDQALKAVGVQPGAKHQGSVLSLLEGKEDVDIAGVELTKQQVEEVASIIDSREELGSIILRNASLDDNMLGILAPSLKNRLDLKMLNLSVNAFGLEGAKHLAEVIRENNSIKMLLLHGNKLNDEGVGILVDAILETTGTAIMNLDLGGCGITQDGAKHIAKLIEHNQTVSILTISGNSIDLEGWKRISKALTKNSTVETISLDFNDLGDEEAIALAEGIQGCSSLSHIDMEGNKIGDEGALKLFKAAKANNSVVDLTLRPMNQVSKELSDEIKQFLTERENDRKNNTRRKEDSYEQEREDSTHEREGEEDKREDTEAKEEGEEDKEEGEEDKQEGEDKQDDENDKQDDEKDKQDDEKDKQDDEKDEQDGEGEKQDDKEVHAETGEAQAEQGEGENINERQQQPGGDQLKESDHSAPEKEGEGNPEEQEPAAPEADQLSGELPAGEQGMTKDNDDEQQNEPGESSEKETSQEDPPEQELPEGGQPGGEKGDATPQDPGESLNQSTNDEETHKADSSTVRDAKGQEESKKDNEEEKEPAADSV